MSVCSPNERVPGNTPTWWLGDCYPCHITPWLREFIAAMEDDPTSAAVLTAQVQFEMLEWWGPDVEFCQDLEVRRG